MNNKTIIAFILGVVLMFFLMKSCESEPKVVTKTETKIVTKHDTIKTVEIKEVPKTVFIEKTKTIKGKDSIIYKDKPSETTIEAKEYKTELRSNNATANLTITAKELYKIDGIITYPKETIKETTTITRDASGFYI